MYIIMYLVKSSDIWLQLMFQNIGITLEFKYFLRMCT